MNYLTICNSIISGIRELLLSNSFMDSHRVENRFIRKRNLSMYQTVLYLLFSSKASLFQNIAAIKDELPDLSFPKVSKQAVSKARQGIFASLFEALFQFSVSCYYDIITSRKHWHGYHIFAIDGTRIQLPNSMSNFDEFGEMSSANNPKRRWSLALGSVIYDVLEDMIIHSSFHGYKYSERTAAMKHLEALENMKLHKKSIVIFDRGYYSQKLYRLFTSQGYYCLMRVKKSLKFVESQTSNDVITLLIDKSKDGQKSIPIRVISVELDTGETEYLVTNIMDEGITTDMFKDLYFKRWKVESKYNEIKNHLLLEEFNGATSTSVQQEFFINLLLSNLSAIVKSDADERINETKDSSSKSNYQSNRAFILGRMKKMLPKLLCGQKCYYSLVDLFEDAYRNRSQFQPNRKCERKRPKRDRKHFNHRKVTI